MKEETVIKEVKTVNKYSCGGSGGAIYGLGFLGALVYFMEGSQTFYDALIGFFKALAWPAFIIYKLLELLKL